MSQPMPFPTNPVRLSRLAPKGNGGAPTLYGWCDYKVSDINGVVFVHMPTGENLAVDSVIDARWVITHEEWFANNHGGNETPLA